MDTSWTEDWPDHDTLNVGDVYTFEDDETSRNDDWYVGHVNFDDWYGDCDWTSWDDDWSWDQAWNSSWNEPSSTSPPSLQDSQNKALVSVTELPSSSTSGSSKPVQQVQNCQKYLK